ncbi:MAG: DUF1194 domain-containing protein [Rubrimonas sp.]|uniref:DUF1194 domain-containing protein n=1 Tax=Rubrimonas sp. TaxID=2036015 RepID=UPI002FDDCB9A
MRRLAPLLALLAALIARPVAAQAPVWDDVDLELVLLADASGSIDFQELRFQRQGYADAMADPLVISAIRDGAHGRIAVTYVEWADAASQHVVVDWMLVGSAEDAALFGDRLMAPPREAFGRNAIGAALMKGVEMIASNHHEGFRKVIDFSGDSANNWNGPSIAAGRQAALDAGITINGLAILCLVCATGRADGYDLEAAFRDRIIGGPGAFVVTADGSEAFANAVRRKLILEISGLEPPSRHAAR